MKSGLNVLSICVLLFALSGCKEEKKSDGKKVARTPAKELANARGFVYADKE